MKKAGLLGLLSRLARLVGIGTSEADVELPLRQKLKRHSSILRYT